MLVPTGRSHVHKQFAIIAALGALVSGQALAALGARPQCDRNCLTGLVDQYLAAMVKHDPAGLPLAPKVKFTEDTAEIPLGDGLWVGASEGQAEFKIYAADVEAGEAGFFGLLREFGKPVILCLRLKVDKGKISEIEHVVARNLRPGALLNLKTPRPGLVEDVPPAERSSRQDMLRIANSYFDAIEQTKGDLAPFADDCERHENGIQTTTNKQPRGGFGGASAILDSLGCKAQIDCHSLSYITRIRPRRLMVVDQEKGLVFAFPMFVHRGNVRTIKAVGVPGVGVIQRPFGPINLQAGEIFKIRDGKIHEIEAAGVLVPYGSKSGWE
jgi:hypothetical protein